MRRSLAPLVISTLLSLAGFLTGCSALDRESILILGDLATGAEPSRWKAITPTPQRNAFRFSVDGRDYRADRYIPSGPIRAGMVLVPGAATGGKDDPRLVAFATTLARAQILLIVPDLPGLRDLKVGVKDIQGVVDSLARLLSDDDLGPDAPAGLGAFSYAVGPALLAALRPEIRDRLDFVLAIGGYNDLSRVLTYFTTGYFQEDGEWRYLAPNRYGRWAFVKSNLDRLSDPADRRNFGRIVERRMRDPNAPIDDLSLALSPEGQTLHRLLENNDPRRTPALIAALPASILADLRALDLVDKVLERLRADLILIHGRDDTIIPYTESVALADRFPADQVELFIVRGLLHVDLESGLLDTWRLWRAVKALLRRRAPTGQSP